MAAIASTPAVAANPQTETNDKDDAAGADENTDDKHSNTATQHTHDTHTATRHLAGACEPSSTPTHGRRRKRIMWSRLTGLLTLMLSVGGLMGGWETRQGGSLGWVGWLMGDGRPMRGAGGATEATQVSTTKAPTPEEQQEATMKAVVAQVRGSGSYVAAMVVAKDGSDLTNETEVEAVTLLLESKGIDVMAEDGEVYEAFTAEGKRVQVMGPFEDQHDKAVAMVGCETAHASSNPLVPNWGLAPFPSPLGAWGQWGWLNRRSPDGSGFGATGASPRSEEAKADGFTPEFTGGRHRGAWDTTREHGAGGMRTAYGLTQGQREMRGQPRANRTLCRTAQHAHRPIGSTNPSLESVRLHRPRYLLGPRKLLSPTYRGWGGAHRVSPGDTEVRMGDTQGYPGTHGGCPGVTTGRWGELLRGAGSAIIFRRRPRTRGSPRPPEGERDST